MTIYGDGFAPRRVKHGDLLRRQTVTPSQATVATLIVTVPKGATTGPIQVRSPKGSFTSPENFTVN